MRLSVSFLSVLVMSAACVASDFGELTAKVPQGANAVMAIDVAKALATPLAKKNGWDRKLSEGGADRPLYLPPEPEKPHSLCRLPQIARQRRAGSAAKRTLKRWRFRIIWVSPWRQ